MTWTAPSATGGGPITGYVVTPTWPVSPRPTDLHIDGHLRDGTDLTNGTAYTFTVAAIKWRRHGETVGAVQLGHSGDRPGRTHRGTATKAGNTSATVNWTAPASNGGSAITGYVVTPTSAAWPKRRRPSARRPPLRRSRAHTVRTAYTFKVAAINAVGTGSQSAASGSVNVYNQLELKPRRSCT